MTEVESLRHQCKAAFDASAPKSPQEQPDWDKKLELNDMLEVHKLLAAKIEAEKLDAVIPKVSPAEIIGPARPGLAPVKPNKPFNIT
jgi:hypothetical protein